MATPTLIVPGAAGALAYARSQISTASDKSTSSGSMAEIDSSLRVTITVGASGAVVVRQCVIVKNTSGGTRAMTLGVQVDGTGSWTTTGGCVPYFANSNDTRPIDGCQVTLTGLSPGSHTFYMGWASDGSSFTCPANSYSAAADGTWQSVMSLG